MGGTIQQILAAHYSRIWFYFTIPPLMETHEKVKTNQKMQETIEHRVAVEQLLSEVELIF